MECAYADRLSKIKCAKSVKRKKKVGKPERKRTPTPSQQHQSAFDQLLEDAIFGAKKPPKRG